MFSFDLTAEQVRYVKDQVVQHNFGRRGDADGDFYQQRLGLYGQVGIVDLLGLPRPDGARGTDDGIDGTLASATSQGVTFDAKGTRMKVQPRPDDVGNFPEAQVHFATDVLIFFRARLDESETEIGVTVCGVISKAEFLKEAEAIPRGTPRGKGFIHNGSHRELKYRRMVDVSSADHLKRVLRRFELLNDTGASMSAASVQAISDADAEELEHLLGDDTHSYIQ